MSESCRARATRDAPRCKKPAGTRLSASSSRGCCGSASSQGLVLPGGGLGTGGSPQLHKPEALVWAAEENRPYPPRSAAGAGGSGWGDSCFVSVTLIRQFGAASECKSLGAVSSRAFKWKDGRGGRESHGGCRSGGVGAVFMRGISLWCFMARKMLFSPGLFD